MSNTDTRTLAGLSNPVGYQKLATRDPNLAQGRIVAGTMYGFLTSNGKFEAFHKLQSWRAHHPNTAATIRAKLEKKLEKARANITKIEKELGVVPVEVVLPPEVLQADSVLSNFQDIFASAEGGFPNDAGRAKALELAEKIDEMVKQYVDVTTENSTDSSDTVDEAVNAAVGELS